MATAYRALIVEAGRDAAAEARVRLALRLTGEFDAHLIGMAACTVVPPFTGPFGTAAVIVDLIDAEEQRIRAGLQATEERFRAAAGAAGRPVEWRAFLEYPGDALAREARAADLLVLGRQGDTELAGIHQATEAGDVLLRAGRPVLIVPPGIDALDARTVLVAWKEAREARRAVIDALPLLTRAERVVVAAACESVEAGKALQRQVEDVAAMLVRHGAKATGETVAREGRSAADALLGEAERLGAGLIVAGGYGQARLREWVFGGVTRDLLTRCPVCCLLSH